jgi:FkbM family methyltransferase
VTNVARRLDSFRFENTLGSPSSLAESVVIRTISPWERWAMRRRVEHLLKSLHLQLCRSRPVLDSIPLANTPMAPGQATAVATRIARSIIELTHLGYSLSIFPHGATLKLASDELTFKTEELGALWLANVCELFSLSRRWGFELLEGDSATMPAYVRIQNDVVEASDGSRFYLETIDPWVFTETFVLKVHDINLESVQTVLDVGAAFGDTAVRFGRLGKDVLALEPANFESLKLNLKLNGISESAVRVGNVAIGPRRRMRMVRTPIVFDGNASGYLRGRGDSFEVESRSIHDALSSFGLDGVDYLKMDCKGCERDITDADLALIYLQAKVEFVCGSREDFRHLLSVLTHSGFECRCYHYNPIDRVRLDRIGTVLGIRPSRSPNNVASSRQTNDLAG